MSKVLFKFPAGKYRRLDIALIAILAISAMAVAYFILPTALLGWFSAFALMLAICCYATVSSFRARKILDEKSRHLETAIEHMSQGLVLFDREERLVLCNRRYIEMYGLPSDIVKPGLSLRELLRLRLETGVFSSDPEKYRADLLDALQYRHTIRNIIEHADGRSMLVINEPLADGGWVGTHEDITHSLRTEQEIRDTKTFLRTVIESVPTTIIVKDARTFAYVLVNRAAEEFFGVSRKKMIGKTVQDILPMDFASRISAEDRDVAQSSKQLILTDQPIATVSNGTRIATTRKLCIPGADGKPQYLLTVIDDVTERKRAEARIAFMEHHDDLTGLPNRAAFNEHLAMTLENAEREKSGFAVFSIDLDRFKNINDVYGHSLGDALLCGAAKRLQNAAQGAFIARLGGDEFAIITAGTQVNSTSALAESLIAAFEDDFDVNGQRLRIGLSIGIALYSVDGADTVTLLGNADAALYRAKSEGRGVIRFFAADLDMRLRERRALQQDLCAAIERKEFVLHYQPQVRIGGGIVGFEALVRWNSPTRGLLSPEKFIPVAEESGLIHALGEWILREACREAATWKKPLRIAVNLSPVQFGDVDFAALVHTILLETGLASKRLDLEITENVLVSDSSLALTTLRRLKALGVEISMDDFGTGYSSLSYLQSFPFDRIKIDRAFISNVERNAQSAAIVRAVIGLGRGLGLPVLAEGVESEDQLSFLMREGCDEVQGFYYGAAKPIENYADAVGRRLTAKLKLAASQ